MHAILPCGSTEQDQCVPEGTTVLDASQCAPCQRYLIYKSCHTRSTAHSSTAPGPGIHTYGHRLSSIQDKAANICCLLPAHHQGTSTSCTELYTCRLWLPPTQASELSSPSCIRAVRLWSSLATRPKSTPGQHLHLCCCSLSMPACIAANVACSKPPPSCSVINCPQSRLRNGSFRHCVLAGRLSCQQGCCHHQAVQLPSLLQLLPCGRPCCCRCSWP